MKLIQCSFEVGLHELGGGNKWNKEGHGGELVGALDAGGNACLYGLGEREVNDGYGCVGERGGDEGSVGPGGEDCDGGGAAAAEEEEAS